MKERKRERKTLMCTGAKGSIPNRGERGEDIGINSSRREEEVAAASRAAQGDKAGVNLN